MDPVIIKVDTEAEILPRYQGFLNTILIHIHDEIEELVIDQNGDLTLLGSYSTPNVSLILSEPPSFSPNYISQLLHNFYISETRLCQILGQLIALACALLHGPRPFLLSLHVKLTRRFLVMFPPSVTSPSRAVSDHVLQRLVDEQRVELIDLGKEDKECSICMENLSETSSREKVIRMPNCLHLFHQDCIFEWLKIQNSCPLCRRVLYEDDDHEAVPETPRFA
ncbi:unnamed protein product [Arabis nemorensis]|uniref:RING-type domain-containing protein n=1 Tax=Arabis nemorensis TaxID=586526 RepID=A0A565BL48_9BRAS|nr:unnamed protein product [Arabis nemorensis]